MYDPQRLAALVAVAEAGSITRAAARLGYTAPALSQQLAKLEREAGTALLVRHHRGTRLTAAGELLLARARRVLDELDQARHELAALTGLRGGRLRVGSFMTAGTHLLPPVLSAFRREHPDVELSVTEYEPPGGVEAVARGDADLALTHAYEPGPAVSAPAGVRVEQLLAEELVLVTAPGHALSAGGGRLPRSALAGQPLVSSAPSHSNRAEVEAVLAAAGAGVAVRCENPGYVLVCALVSAGLGVAVVPEMVTRLAVTPLGVRRLDPPTLRRTIHVAYREGDTGGPAGSLRALLRGTYGRSTPTPPPKAARSRRSSRRPR